MDGRVGREALRVASAAWAPGFAAGACGWTSGCHACPPASQPLSDPAKCEPGDVACSSGPGDVPHEARPVLLQQGLLPPAPSLGSGSWARRRTLAWPPSLPMSSLQRLKCPLVLLLRQAALWKRLDTWSQLSPILPASRPSWPLCFSRP